MITTDCRIVCYHLNHGRYHSETIETFGFIPRQPLKKSPQKLQDDLQIGFEVSIRTIQRDLKVLSSILPLISDERDKPYGWSWHREAVGLSPPWIQLCSYFKFS